MKWKKDTNLCFCSYKRNQKEIRKWISERPDPEDSPSPCYFCVIRVDPEIFELEFNIKIDQLPDIYCPECNIPRKSNTECLQPACSNNNHE